MGWQPMMHPLTHKNIRTNSDGLPAHDAHPGFHMRHWFLCLTPLYYCLKYCIRLGLFGTTKGWY